MKNATFIAAMAAFVLLLHAERAEADEPGDSGKSTTLVFANPDQAKCVADCMKPTAAKKAPAAVKRPKKQAKPRKPYCPQCVLALRIQVDSIMDQLEGLHGRIGALGRTDANFQRELEELKIRVKTLEERADNFGQLNLVLAMINARLKNVERQSSAIRLAPLTGFVVFHSSDGTTYTGGALGLRLTTTLAPKYDFGFEGAALLANNDRPFGTLARGFLSRQGLDSRFALELGLSATWIQYDNQAKAKSLFVSGDVAAKVVLYKGLWASLGVHLGAEIDKDDPSFAFGGVGKLGYEF